MVVDVVGFSRMVREDEPGTLARFKAVRCKIVDPCMAMFHGRIFKETGDGLLIEFVSAVDALSAALFIQNAVGKRNAGLTADENISFRIGLHQGDVRVQGSDLVGDTVNVAARLEKLAPTGGICVSDRVREDAVGKLRARVDFDDQGEQDLRTGRAVRVLLIHPPVPAPPDEASDGAAPFGATHQLLLPALPGLRDHIRLHHEPITIGRTLPCDIVLPGTEVSRLHCRLELVGDRVFVTDLRSTNGTFVDGERIAQPTRLEHAARLQIGTHTIQYRCDSGRDEDTLIQSPRREPIAPGPPVEPKRVRAAVPPEPEPTDAKPPAEVHNLPIEATSFIGREEELDEIGRLLRERRRLTLVGSGGVGKTRTALRVGTACLDAYRDGVWLVELAPLADPGLAAEALCRAVSAPVSGNRPPVEVAVSFLRQKQLLLILDNCEHLLGAAAELAAALLAQCPLVSILATSREPLRIPGEVVFRLPSLPVPGVGEDRTAVAAMRFASVRLFVQRASDVFASYRLSDADAPAVGAICRRLSGVPMAIELAAARARVLKPAEISSRLENKFRLLNTGGKSSMARHETLWATIDWSHSLLSPSEQILLRRLSVFVGGFSLEGATSVAEGDGIESDDVLDLLELLIDKSLINTDMSGAATRFRMLEATRHYAREKLTASGETGRDRRAAAYMADFYARAEATWPTMPTEAWLDVFGPEVENLRAAIDWAFGHGSKYGNADGASGDPALGITLVAHAGCVAEEMSLQADMNRWTQAALAHLTPETPKALAAWVKFWATKWQGVFGVGEVSPMRREAIALFRAAGDEVGLSCALRNTAMTIARPGQMPAEVGPMLHEAVRLLRGRPPTKDLATALAHMGSFHLFNGDYHDARRYYEEAQAMRRNLGDRTGILASSLNLAELEFLSGDAPRAIAYATQAVAEARRAGNVAILAHLLANMAGYLLARDDVAGARAAAGEALTLYRALGHQDWAPACVEHLALAAAISGAPQQAARLLGYSSEYFRRTDQTRDRMEQAGYERLLALLRGALPEASLEALMAEGAAWPDKVADAAALADAPVGSYDVAAA
jgi:predicted ATPase/class 3 adenylate cyclase/pSer/pThr/pTyr-binding forkhead associated (FHA) protein